LEKTKIGKPKKYRLNGGIQNGAEHLRKNIISKEAAS
jgi:hypothetical protein